MPGRYSPINPVALSTSIPSPNVSLHSSSQAAIAVSAIVGTNADLMKNAAQLWIRPTDVILDSTYGRGAFWTKLPGMPTYAHDLITDGVDCRKLPEPDCSCDVVVIDPPYRPTHRSKGFELSGNSLASSYQLGSHSLDTIMDVLDLYEGAIGEAERVLKRGGRVLVKCQDLSYDHRLHLVTLDVLRLMTKYYLHFADQFILVNTQRLTSPKWEEQERARRSHSVLWVGVKE